MSNELEHQLKGAAGRWTKQQHQRFLQGLELFGRNWKQISKHVGTRNGAQIRSHAQKYFDRIQKGVQQKGCTAQGLGQRLSSTSEITSAPEQETNIAYSFYFTEISKYVSENNALSLFEELFDVENKNSFTNTEEIENKFRHSFTLYQPKEKEKEETSQTNIDNI